MRHMRSSTLLLTLPALLGLVLPTAVGAGSNGSPAAVDVLLHDGGLLVGQVVGTQGHGKGDVVVSLRQQHHEIVRVQTDDTGRFAVKGLRTGAYQLVSRTGQIHVRAWTKSAAPPNAVQQALLVDGFTFRGKGEDEYVGSSENNSILLNSPTELPPPDQSLSVEEAPYTNHQTFYTSEESGNTDHMQEPAEGSSPPMWSERPYNNGAAAYGNTAPVQRRGLLSRPWIWGTGLAAAIAIPIALHDDDAS
jgi:hypothetical protein